MFKTLRHIAGHRHSKQQQIAELKEALAAAQQVAAAAIAEAARARAAQAAAEAALAAMKQQLAAAQEPQQQQVDQASFSGWTIFAARHAADHLEPAASAFVISPSSTARPQGTVNQGPKADAEFLSLAKKWHSPRRRANTIEWEEHTSSIFRPSEKQANITSTSSKQSPKSTSLTGQRGNWHALAGASTEVLPYRSAKSSHFSDELETNRGPKYVPVHSSQAGDLPAMEIESETFLGRGSDCSGSSTGRLLYISEDSIATSDFFAIL